METLPSRNLCRYDGFEIVVCDGAGESIGDDALLLGGFIRQDEVALRLDQAHWPGLMDELVAAGRAVKSNGFWTSIERFEELDAVVPQGIAPAIPERIRKQWTREEAARELVRGRMEILGPVTAQRLS